MTEHNSTFKPILKSVLVPLIFPVSAWWDRQFEQRFLEQNWCDTQWLLNMHIAVGLKVVVIPVLELLFHLKFSNDHAEGHLDWVSFWLHFMNTSKVEQTNAIVQLTVNQKVHWNFISNVSLFCHKHIFHHLFPLNELYNICFVKISIYTMHAVVILCNLMW